MNSILENLLIRTVGSSAGGIRLTVGSTSIDCPYDAKTAVNDLGRGLIVKDLKSEQTWSFDAGMRLLQDNKYRFRAEDDVCGSYHVPVTVVAKLMELQSAVHALGPRKCHWILRVYESDKIPTDNYDADKLPQLGRHLGSFESLALARAAFDIAQRSCKSDCSWHRQPHMDRLFDCDDRNPASDLQPSVVDQCTYMRPHDHDTTEETLQLLCIPFVDPHSRIVFQTRENHRIVDEEL